MYGKFFASTFTGSMLGAGADVFAVWGYVIANTVHSSVELNPNFVAMVLGMTVEEVEKAIEFLCRPDLKSRNPDQEGRRLLPQGGFLYHVVTHEIYRAIRDEDDRKRQNREAQQRHRAKISSTKHSGINKSVSPDNADAADSQHVSPYFADGQHGQPRKPMSAHTEAYTDTEAEERKTVGTTSSEVESETTGNRNIKSASAFILPDWIPHEIWNGFVEMRRKKRLPLTENAKRIIVRKLTEIGGDPVQVLEQSTANSWTSVWPLQEFKSNGKPRPEPRRAKSTVEEIIRDSRRQPGPG